MERNLTFFFMIAIKNAQNKYSNFYMSFWICIVQYGKELLTR